MAITPIDSVYSGFTFDGEDSRDYGVYVNDVSVFDAPEKDIEMIEIPGRNGAYALDRGRFMNIEVTYHCVLGASSDDDWSEGVSNLRNFLASRKGYCVLEDDFNAGEYRLAVYRSGLNVSNINTKIGEFDVVFDCKPQRWLTAGQAAISMTSGDEVENPTLFDASPLLMIDGYGTINLGADTIKINDVPIGNYLITENIGDTFTASVAYDLNLSLLNNGDRFYIPNYGNSVHINATADPDYTPTAGYIDATASNTIPWGSARAFAAPSVDIDFGPVNFVKGTASTETISGTWTTTDADGLECAWLISWAFAYNGTSRLTVTFTSAPVEHATLIDWSNVMLHITQIIGVSSKGSLGAPLYLDLDIGEAYKIEGGQVVSVNNAVTLGATLPTLPPGETEVTFPATITSLEIVPRYWKL